jgi:hypothetical protein
MPSEFPWLGFIFWAGLFIWFGISSWGRYLREQERQKTLRAFAERGTPLDKEMMERLFPAVNCPPGQAPWRPSPQAAARGLVIGGIVSLFAGIGLLIGAQLIAHIQRAALFGMSTGGVIAGCVGLGLITASLTLRRMHERDQDRAAGAGDATR